MNLYQSLLLSLTLLSCLSCKDSDKLPDAPTARYRLTFNATWSAQTHPTDFPASAHFSGLIGMTHSQPLALFAESILASEGIKRMAELGSKSPLDDEINAKIASGTAKRLLSGGAISSSPGSVTMEFTIDNTASLVSILSMVAPSPDWFVGVQDVNLINKGEWILSKTIPVSAWDAGTDSGSSYSSSDSPTNPRETISILIIGPLANSGVATNIGTITFEKID